MHRSNLITDEDEDDSRPSVTIRKRTAVDRPNIFSSMITVPEDNSTQSAENVVTPAADTETNSSKQPRSSSRGSMLDDSVRSSAENSLVHKMAAALNEESWWNSTKRNSSPPPPSASADTVDPPIKTLLLSDDEKQLSSGGNSRTTTQKNKNKVKSKRADCIFGIVLLTVGFVVGGVFIHREKVMMEMNSLLRGGTHSKQQGGGEGTRQLPIVQHTLTYEERQQLYREQRQAGNLRPIVGNGKNAFGIDEQERLRYQQYYGYDQKKDW
eukprot:scaffold7325_cov153-Skeletonema_menzelii.AAC.7